MFSVKALVPSRTAAGLICKQVSTVSMAEEPRSHSSIKTRNISLVLSLNHESRVGCESEGLALLTVFKKSCLGNVICK